MIPSRSRRRTSIQAPRDWRIRFDLLVREQMESEAEKHLRQAEASDAERADGYVQLALLHKQLSHFAEVVRLLHEAVSLQPNNPFYLHEYGAALFVTGEVEAAQPVLHRALEQDAENPHLLKDCAFVSFRLGQSEQAEALIRQAARRTPDDPIIRIALAGILERRGHVQEALTTIEETVRLYPDHRNAHDLLTHMYLRSGDYVHGWREFELRAQMQQHQARSTTPKWDGSNLNGKTVLVYAEQGLGDMIQFVRFLPLLQQRGARVILEEFAPLSRLFETARGYDTKIVGDGIRSSFDVHHNCWIPLMSLPGVLQVAPDTMSVPYLHAQPDLVEKWSARIQEPARLRVGMVWAGSSTNISNAFRSCTAEHFLPLGSIPGVQLYSVQKGSALPAGIPVIDLAPHLEDFADTAAALQVLDLLITVDTSVAHLAGALGRPVWVLLDTESEWRWLLDRPDSPWYPTMRLFRQQKPGSWSAVFTEVETALRALIAETT